MVDSLYKPFDSFQIQKMACNLPVGDFLIHKDVGEKSYCIKLWGGIGATFSGEKVSSEIKLEKSSNSEVPLQEEEIGIGQDIEVNRANVGYFEGKRELNVEWDASVVLQQNGDIYVNAILNQEFNEMESQTLETVIEATTEWSNRDEFDKFNEHKDGYANFLCDQCDFVTNNKRNLKTHADVVHRNIKFHCNFSLSFIHHHQDCFPPHHHHHHRFHGDHHE